MLPAQGTVGGFRPSGGGICGHTGWGMQVCLLYTSPASEGSPGIEGKQISSMEGAPVMSGYDRGFRTVCVPWQNKNRA